MAETQRRKVEHAHIGLDRAHRVIRVDIILDPRRQQAALAAARPVLNGRIVMSRIVHHGPITQEENSCPASALNPAYSAPTAPRYMPSVAIPITFWDRDQVSSVPARAAYCWRRDFGRTNAVGLGVALPNPGVGARQPAHRWRRPTPAKLSHLAPPRRDGAWAEAPALALTATGAGRRAYRRPAFGSGRVTAAIWIGTAR